MRTIILALGVLSGCCFTPSGGTFTPTFGPPGGSPYTVDPAIPTWSPAYAGSMMHDGNPATYWCTNASPVFPITTTLTLAAPTNVMDVDFDTRLPGYATSGVQDVTIETFGASGVAVGLPVAARLHMDAVTSVPVVAVGVTSIRLTFRSNHGGAYAGLSELVIQTVPGRERSPVPPTGPLYPPPPTLLPPVLPPTPGLPYVVDPLIPTWSSGYAASMMQDGNPATYWCSPTGPTYPIVTTLTLLSPNLVNGLAFNTVNTGYPNIGPNGVMIEAIDPMGAVVGVASGSVLMNTTSTVAFTAPVFASSIRLTIHSNHGGAYVGITELVVMSLGLPPLPPG